MNTTYHIGDIFKLPRKNVLAVITAINTTNYEKYAVTYIDDNNYNVVDSGKTLPRIAWWTTEELQNTFKEKRILRNNGGI